jgi:hypothetical protein
VLQIDPQRLAHVARDELPDVATSLLLGVTEGPANVLAEPADLIGVARHASAKAIDLVQDASHQLVGGSADRCLIGRSHHRTA